ncbi:MAG: S41 family peptidase [Candidatus Glassbacteria bacterium]
MLFRKERSPYFYASLTLAVLVLVGWLFGRLLATSDNLYMRIRLLQDVVNEVSQRYVDEIATDQLYHRAVEGLLKGLDPYTELIPAEDFKRFQEIQVKSEYVGTGMSIGRTGGQIVVMSTFPGSSAYKQGIQPGDLIIKVGDQPTADWTTEQASLHLLGPEGSQVALTVARQGATEPLEFTLTRKPVVVPTVTRHFMLEGGVGYVRLSSFTEKSADELRRSVEDLLSKGMKSLILDLRDNSGGLTDSAIDICELFIGGKKLIVAIRGRRPEDSASYFSKGDAVFAGQPLAVLINEFTASSSEIVAGALQDHDRAVIVGENSYGKGLVQTTFPLKSGDVLKITTARYYTPSGRNIQREHFRRIGNYDEEENEKPTQTTFKTDMGREVLGGGGIMPDVAVYTDSASFDPYIVELLPHSFDFAVAYKSMNPGIDHSFRADSKTFEAFVNFLNNKGFQVNDKKLQKYRNYITDLLLTYRIGEVTWDDNSAYQMVAQADPQLTRAVEVLGSSPVQKEILRKISEETRK